mgnify:CR=1 FL=1
MEITIVIGMGESLQDVLRRTKLNPVGPMTLTLTSETQIRAPEYRLVETPVKPVGKKRGPYKKRKKPRKTAKRGRPKKMPMSGKTQEWTETESAWMASQTRPRQTPVARIGRDKVSAVEAAFAEKFGYRRTYKSLMSKWNRLNKK